MQDALEKKGMSKVRQPGSSGHGSQGTAARSRSTWRILGGIQWRLMPPSANRLHTCPLQTTFEFHYGKHHAAYLNNLNGQIAGKDLEKLSIEEVRTAACLMLLFLWQGGRVALGGCTARSLQAAGSE